MRSCGVLFVCVKQLRNYVIASIVAIFAVCYRECLPSVGLLCCRVVVQDFYLMCSVVIGCLSKCCVPD